MYKVLIDNIGHLIDGPNKEKLTKKCHDHLKKANLSDTATSQDIYGNIDDNDKIEYPLIEKINVQTTKNENNKKNKSIKSRRQLKTSQNIKLYRSKYVVDNAFGDDTKYTQKEEPDEQEEQEESDEQEEQEAARQREKEEEARRQREEEARKPREEDPEIENLRKQFQTEFKELNDADKADKKKALYKLLRKYHPDNNVNVDGRIKPLYNAFTSQLNDYNTEKRITAADGGRKTRRKKNKKRKSRKSRK